MRDMKTEMKRFITPAGQIDFPNDPKKQELLNKHWTLNLTGFTDQGITGNPWNATNSDNNTWYFNPTTTDTSQAVYQPIQWNPFPNRLHFYYGGGGGKNANDLQLSAEDLLSLADTGKTTHGTPFSALPPITNPCDGTSRPYGPYGPRGWLDEYCEWSVERDANNNIVRIDFTCENPEYWNTLWAVDPDAVVALYRKTLGKPQITLQDLCLMQPGTSQPVIDPSTGRPAYNPLNKWNTGTRSTATEGGAMHLTSTPNTLQTEIGLGSAATTPRKCGNSDFMRLICCARYGQPARNSDPNIGGAINQLVAPPDPSQSPLKVTLANPPGLYIQTPDFKGNNYKTPWGSDGSDCWTIVRGAETLKDEYGRQLPGNYILHATFMVPENQRSRYTVSDITINGQRIRWAGQVAQTFFMQITGMGLPQSSPAPVKDCAGDAKPALAQPLQLFHAGVAGAMFGTQVSSVMGVKMNLASNSTLIAPIVKAGQSNIKLVLTCSTLTQGTPTVSFGDSITVKVDEVTQEKYAVPGNTYPDEVFLLRLTVSVAATAQRGLRGVFVTNPDQPQSPYAFPAALNVVD